MTTPGMIARLRSQWEERAASGSPTSMLQGGASPGMPRKSMKRPDSDAEQSQSAPQKFNSITSRLHNSAASASTATATALNPRSEVQAPTALTSSDVSVSSRNQHEQPVATAAQNGDMSCWNSDELALSPHDSPEPDAAGDADNSYIDVHPGEVDLDPSAGHSNNDDCNLYLQVQSSAPEAPAGDNDNVTATIRKALREASRPQSLLLQHHDRDDTTTTPESDHHSDQAHPAGDEDGSQCRKSQSISETAEHDQDVVDEDSPDFRNIDRLPTQLSLQADPGVHRLRDKSASSQRGSQFQLHPSLSRISLDRPRLNTVVLSRTSAAAVIEDETIEQAPAQLSPTPEPAQDNIFWGFSSTLTKIRNLKFYRRKYTIPDDQSSLSWNSDKKRSTESKLLMSQIQAVLPAEDIVNLPALPPNLELTSHQRKRLFCIEYQTLETESKRDTLYLMADSDEDYHMWTEALKAILARSQLLLEYMKSGATFTKCRPKEKYERRYYLSDDCKEIWWHSTKDESGKRSIELKAVHFVRAGQVTAAFNRTKNVAQFASRSFSLVYGPQFDTLDLIAHREDDYMNWLHGLQMLVTGAGESQVTMQKGVNMVQIAGKGSRHVERRCFLSPDKDSLFWELGRRQESVSISSIKELRRGKNTSGHRGNDNDFAEERCFSIIHGSQYQELDFYIPNALDFRDWMLGLEDLLYNTQELTSMAALSEGQLRTAFQRRAGRNSTVLKPKAVIQLLASLEPALATPAIRQQIRQFMINAKKGIDAEQFVDLYNRLIVRQDLLEIFVAYGTLNQPECADATAAYTMTPQQLQKFLLHEQKLPGDVATLEHCKALIRNFEPEFQQQKPDLPRSRRPSYQAHSQLADSVPEPTDDGEAPLYFSARGLANYLLSSEGDAFNTLHDTIFMDMTRPLNEYFISSSHNTYLTADQLKGASSTEMYVRTLMRGCRSVEIDCWDGPCGEPVIYHGHTLTSKIGFCETIDAINAYAFRASSYPLIISVENHCCLAQQRFMAQYMKKVFGSKLVEVPDGVVPAVLPSPESLRNKILIKCHAPLGLHHCRTIVSYDDSGRAYDGSDRNPGNFSAADSSLSENDDVIVETAPGDAEDEDDAGSGAADEMEGQTRPHRPSVQIERTDSKRNPSANSKKRPRYRHQIRMHKEFTDLIHYTASVPRFEGFDHARLFNACWIMTSFGETRMAAISADPMQAGELVRMTKAQNTRTFPAGTRVNSSNFDPQQMWLAGCQMVALNWQTDGAPMQLNQGKFRANGGCGYLLKPLALRDPAIDFDPHTLPGCPPAGSQPMYLQIRIISAQQLPRAKVINPFVSLELIGLRCDQARQQTEAQVKEGAAPLWNETFGFNITMPEISMLKLEVMDGRGKLNGAGFLAEASLPIDSLRQGYRHVRLNGANAEPLAASLFVHITWSRCWKSQEFLSKRPKPPMLAVRLRDIIPRYVAAGDRKLDQKLQNVPALLRQLLQLREKALQLMEQLEEESGTPARRNTLGSRAMKLAKSGPVTQLRPVLKYLQELQSKFDSFAELVESARQDEQWKNLLLCRTVHKPTQERQRLAFEYLCRRVRQGQNMAQRLVQDVKKAAGICE